MPARTSRTTSSTLKKAEYYSNGIEINPAIPTAGDSILLKYDGLLAKSGANDVFAHVGFDSDWKDTYDYMMRRTPEGFETTIPVSKAKMLNISFKDSASNWDNNSGNNYTFPIS
jgi:hypothetical protein